MDIHIKKSLPRLNNPYQKIVVSSTDSKADIFVTNFVQIWEACKKINNRVAHETSTLVIDISQISTSLRECFLNRIVQGLYEFVKYKSNVKRVSTLYIIDPKLPASHQSRLTNMLKLANQVRDLANEPSNKSPPIVFCNLVRDFLKDIPNVTIVENNEDFIKDANLNLIDAVGSGSRNPPRFLVVQYTPSSTGTSIGATCPICLVGKGVTIDTGGYDIKTKSGMYGMHLDNTGGSIVIGLIKHCAMNKFNKNVVGIIPLVENIITERSVKPGDIIKAYNGKTVEVVDTDAEGRLILADALAYACSVFKPCNIIDFATLTGWSSRIHCHTSYTYFTMDEAISQRIIDIGENVGERSMRLPPWPEYIEYTKSDVADVKNYMFMKCENSDGFMAAMFLLNFIPPKYYKNWIHFDIKTNSLHGDLGMADGFVTGVHLLDTLGRSKKANVVGKDK